MEFLCAGLQEAVGQNDMSEDLSVNVSKDIDMLLSFR